MDKFVDIENKRYNAIEGWRGTLVFNKMLYRNTLYGFINPIVQPDVSIYALKSKSTDRLFGFALTTNYCYHYKNSTYYFPNNVSLYEVCTGYVCYSGDMTNNEARLKCKEVAEVLKTVDTGSMPCDNGSSDDDVNNILVDLADNRCSPSKITNFKKYFKKML